jgi:hypothetical protein
MLAIAFVLVVAILTTLIWGRGGRLKGVPFERRRFVSPDEARCLHAVSEAAGAAYWVYPKVAAASLLESERRLGRVQRRAALTLLQTACADLLICTRSDIYPVCIVRLHPAKAASSQARLATRMQAAFANAGIPVVELFLSELPRPEALKQLVQDAISMSDVRVVTAPDLVRDDDEASVLTELAAAMQDSDALKGKR